MGGDWLTDPDLSAAAILEAVADRSALEQVFHDVKEVHGAGQQQLRLCVENVGAWNLIGWWHTLVELWAWNRPQARLATGATRRGTSQSVVRRMPIAVRSYVARRYRKNIRRYRQWRACAEKSAGSFIASCAGSHEADSSGKCRTLQAIEYNKYNVSIYYVPFYTPYRVSKDRSATPHR